MMFGAGSSMADGWDAHAWSGGNDHNDQQTYDDPNTYWGKGARITRPGNNHAPGRSDPYGHSTTKIPPYWEPGDERQYPFDIWVTYIESWCVVAETFPERHAAAIGLRLGGTAKDMYRKILARTLRDGITDMNTGLHESGLELLLRELRERYGKLSIETSMHATTQLLKFQRRSGERFDEANSRFENIRIRCNRVSPEFQLPWPLKALLYLDSMGTHVAPGLGPLGRTPPPGRGRVPAPPRQLEAAGAHYRDGARQPVDPLTLRGG